MNQDKFNSWKKARQNRLQISVDELIDGFEKKEIGALSKALTLAESDLAEHQDLANELIAQLLTKSGNSFRIGITGVPGVGKSSFIEKFGEILIEQGHKVAVLAVDPSSEANHGSILGDKTRMEKLAQNPNAFIRPSPSQNHLGGIAKKTRESIILCEAFGFDIILIETVGVGQSETTVHHLTDMFMLLQIAGAGDELQGIKRGIMEIADIVIITKKDDQNAKLIQQASNAYRNALHLFPFKEKAWHVPVMKTSIFDAESIKEVIDCVKKYNEHIILNTWKENNRANQNLYWFKNSLYSSLWNELMKIDKNKSIYNELIISLNANEISPFAAAKLFFEKISYGKN